MGQTGNYWKRVHQRAMRDARDALWIETKDRLVVAVILAGLSVALVWILGGAEAALAELVAKIAYTAAILLLFPAIYVWKFVVAPAGMDAAEQAAAAELRSALDNKERVQSALDELSDMRRAAIDNLLHGPVATMEDAEKLAQQIATWCEAVGARIEVSFGRSQRNEFDSLGVMDTWLPGVNHIHSRELTMLASKLERLQGIINRFAVRNG